MARVAVRIAFLLSLLVSGCHTPELSPMDITGPGWVTQHGQAIWHARPGAPELAGELLFATNQLGDFVLSFSKPPMDLVLARRVGETWTIEFPAERRRFGGHGAATQRLLWLHLPGALAGRPLRTPLQFESDAGGGWRLANARTGETLEGYLAP